MLRVASWCLECGVNVEKAEIKVLKVLFCYALKRLGLDANPPARWLKYQQILLLRDAS